MVLPEYYLIFLPEYGYLKISSGGGGGGGAAPPTPSSYAYGDDVKKQDYKQSWPPQMSLEMINDAIPTSMTRFLQEQQTAQAHPTECSGFAAHLARTWFMPLRVVSGKVKPMKHITLPFTVKSLTGNVELVHILNRLGHGVSYSQLQEIDTALCLQKLSLSDCQPALPRDIYPRVFTTLAWDNIDRLEETLSGEGTSHRVNGIAVQAKSQIPQPVKPMPCLPKTKKRSISCEPLLLPTYNAGIRAGPSQMREIEGDTRDEVKLAKQR